MNDNDDGRAVCNWGGIVGFDWGRSVLASVFRRALMMAVLIEYARAGRLSMAMIGARVVMPELYCAVLD